MPAIAIRILVIGTSTTGTKSILNRLEKRGWCSRTVLTLREGKELLHTLRFDLVLTSESLSDGRGYDVSEAVARQSATLLVSVPLSESLLWLPVVDRGLNVLGKRAINATVMESEAQNLLAERGRLTNREAGTIAMSLERVPRHTGIPRMKKALLEISKVRPPRLRVRPWNDGRVF
jgi:hypothetical protein